MNSFIKSAMIVGYLIYFQMPPALADYESLEDHTYNLINSLDEAQQRELSFDFNHEARRDWTYLPWGHHGLALKDMSGEQQTAAMALLRTVLSQSGIKTVRDIFTLEETLHRQTWFKPFRDPKRYYMAVFGQPGPTPWSWRFSGHHLAINITAVGGQVRGTPFFTGANPALVTEGPDKGLRVLAGEEDDARALYLSLDDKLRIRALILDTAPSDIVTARDAEFELPCCEGLAASDMTQVQQQALLALVHRVTSRLQSDLAADLEASLAGDGVESLYFAWAGSAKPGEGHYYRIQGPTLLIEYDNTQNDANHIHLVLRDLRTDFGADLLEQHYSRYHH